MLRKKAWRTNVFTTIQHFGNVELVFHNWNSDTGVCVCVGGGGRGGRAEKSVWSLFSCMYREITQCPNVCRDNFKYFSEMLKHVVEKHVKINHVCHVCMTSGDSKKESNQDIKGVFKFVCVLTSFRWHFGCFVENFFSDFGIYNN